MSIRERIAKVYQQIPSTIRLIAVTKQVDPQRMRETYIEGGIRDFGESKLQEALTKQDLLGDLDNICWHFIGHLQANKAKKVLSHFQWIHSVDNLSLLQRLDRLAQEMHLQPSICLQVKALSDPNKFGWTLEELRLDISELEKCQTVQIKGLMTILPWGLSNQEKLTAFSAVRDLAKDISKSSSLSLNELSMGMSGDYLEAVTSGATMIRLGQGIFGSRE